MLAKEVIDYAKNVLEPEMKAVAPEAGFEFQDRAEFAGLDTRAENAEVTLLAKQLSGRNSHSKVAYGTEGGLFSQAGIPTWCAVRARSIRRTRPTSSSRSPSSRNAAYFSTA